MYEKSPEGVGQWVEFRWPLCNIAQLLRFNFAEFLDMYLSACTVPPKSCLKIQNQFLCTFSPAQFVSQNPEPYIV